MILLRILKDYLKMTILVLPARFMNVNEVKKRELLLQILVVNKILGFFLLIYCRTGFIRPCFNFAHFAQLTVGELKTRVIKHSRTKCIVHIVTGQIQNRSK